MAVYSYTGFDGGGKNAAGTIEAVTEQAALDLLEAEGIVPVSIGAGAASVSTDGAGVETKPKGHGRVSLVARTLFVRELATFVRADVPLLEALEVLRRQEKNPAFKAILDDVHDRVRGGESFSHALTAHPRVFSPLLINMVRVGETGGLLGPVLEQMATWMEHEEEVRGEVRGALAYPIVILVLACVTMIIIFTFVMPRITKIFGPTMTLPLITKIMMGISRVMGEHWWKLLIAIGAALWGGRRFGRSARGRLILDRALLRFPFVGGLILHASIARFSRACAALLASGVPLLEALRVVRGVLENSEMREMVERTIERVTRGHSLAKSLEDSPWFPPSAVHLLGVGERTGTLGVMFERVAQTFERQTRIKIKSMLELLSPLLIIGLAVVVGTIAVSILLPILTLNSQMK